MKNGYLFSWDEIPGKDDEKLREFLRRKNISIDLASGGVAWVTWANIEKTENDKTIMLSYDIHHLTLSLNNKITKIIIKFDDDSNYELDVNVNIEKGRINIYERSYEVFNVIYISGLIGLLIAVNVEVYFEAYKITPLNSGIFGLLSAIIIGYFDRGKYNGDFGGRIGFIFGALFSVAIGMFVSRNYDSTVFGVLAGILILFFGGFIMMHIGVILGIVLGGEYRNRNIISDGILGVILGVFFGVTNGILGATIAIFIIPTFAGIGCVVIGQYNKFIHETSKKNWGKENQKKMQRQKEEKRMHRFENMKNKILNKIDEVTKRES